MDLSRRCILHLVAAAASLTVRARIAQADNFPSRPITWVVPFPAGGPMDTLSRVLTERLRQVIGQPIIIENVSGAAGSIGVGRVARASPDGYTLIHGIWSTHVVNAIVYKLPYHVLNDFTPIALLTDNSMLIVGRKTLPAKNLQELIDWLKTKPEGALAGTAGVGSPQHVFAVFFEEQTGTHLRFVHYHGGAPAMQDLLAGRIRSDDCRSNHRIAANSQRQYQGLRRHIQNAPCRTTGYSHCDPIRFTHVLGLGVGRGLGPKGNSSECHRKIGFRYH